MLDVSLRRQTTVLLAETPKETLESLSNNFIDYCQSMELARDTIRTRKTHLKQFNAFCNHNNLDLYSLNNIIMDTYFFEYANDHSISTANAARRILKVFFRWVIGYKEIDLCVKPDFIKYIIEPKKLPKALDRDIILKAISIASPQDALLIDTKWRAGLRISELVAIREQDIHNDELLIHGKGAVERKVYVTDELAYKLNSKKTSNPERHIFRNQHGEDRPMCKNAARLHIQRVFAKLGVDMNPHQLRHSFAVELLINGCDLVSIQTMMGHADITTTQIYLRLVDRQVKAQYKKHMI